MAQKKKLYRDVDDRWLGGVCSGLAAYADCDVSLIRVGFVFAAFASCFMALPGYLAAWIIMPGAKTVQEKKEMRGE